MADVQGNGVAAHHRDALDSAPPLPSEPASETRPRSRSRSERPAESREASPSGRRGEGRESRPDRESRRRESRDRRRDGSRDDRKRDRSYDDRKGDRSYDGRKKDRSYDGKKRDRSYDGKKRDRSYDDDRKKDRSYDERERRRDRSGERHRSREKSQERETSHDRDARSRRDARPSPDRRRRRPERSYSPPHPPRRRRSPPPKRPPRGPVLSAEERAARDRESELAAMDRDLRTVFAYNLPLRAEERELFAFFAAAGPLSDIKIIRDRGSGRSKGVAYVEYERRADVVGAMSLSGRPLLGQPVMVKMSEAEKNLAWEAQEAQKAAQRELEAAGAAAGVPPPDPAALAPPSALVPGLLEQMMGPQAAAAAAAAPRAIVVSGVHPSIGREDLAPVFAPFGALEGVSPAPGAPETFVVTYASPADAASAAQHLDGFELVGRRLGVRLGASASAADAAQRQLAELQAGAVLPDDLDGRGATDGGGMRMTAAGRWALMERLAAGAGMALPAAPPAGGARPAPAARADPLALEQGALGPASPIPTPCLLLKNMFDPGEESEPGWEQDIAADVRDECGRFGEVRHAHVDRDSRGFVYLRFGDAAQAQAAHAALHGRWFAGRQVAACYQFAAVYYRHFGLK